MAEGEGCASELAHLATSHSVRVSCAEAMDSAWIAPKAWKRSELAMRRWNRGMTTVVRGRERTRWTIPAAWTVSWFVNWYVLQEVTRAHKVSHVIEGVSRLPTKGEVVRSGSVLTRAMGEPGSVS